MQRRAERSGGLPLIARLMLAAAVVLLGVVILWASTGQLGRVVRDFGDSMSGIITKAEATEAPASAAPLPLPPSPILIAPAESYTNQATVDIRGTLPTEVAGQSGF